MGYLKQRKKKFFRKETKPLNEIDETDSEGISMPLVRKLVELHGGTFSVTSTAGEGTYAIISLPLKKRLISEEKTENEPQEEESLPLLDDINKEEPVIEFKKVVNS